MTEDEAFAARLREGTLRAFGVKPWDIGLEPVPRRVRFWRKITFARWRYALVAHVIDGLPDR